MTQKRLKVFVQPPWEDGAEHLFGVRYQSKFELVGTPEACDIIVFNGGEDISPRLYGEEPLRGTYFNDRRDAVELAGYDRAKDKFKFGICRGGQLLNVLSGGRLWQHVDNHHGAHDMVDVATGRRLRTSSVHHQQFILGPGATLVASAKQSTKRFNAKGLVIPEEDDVDPEVAWYANTRSLCIQGHPEYSGYPEFSDYCINLIERFY